MMDSPTCGKHVGSPFGIRRHAEMVLRPCLEGMNVLDSNRDVGVLLSLAQFGGSSVEVACFLIAFPCLKIVSRRKLHLDGSPINGVGPSSFFSLKAFVGGTNS